MRESPNYHNSADWTAAPDDPDFDPDIIDIYEDDSRRGANGKRTRTRKPVLSPDTLALKCSLKSDRRRKP